MAITGRQVSVASTATLLTTAETDNVYGSAIQLANRHAANSAFLGAVGVTTLTGYELKAGENFSLKLSPGEALYGIATVASTVHVLETGV